MSENESVESGQFPCGNPDVFPEVFLHALFRSNFNSGEYISASEESRSVISAGIREFKE